MSDRQLPSERGLSEAPQVIPGTQADRDQRKRDSNEQDEHLRTVQNRSRTVRRALMAAGTGLLALVVARGGIGGSNQSTETTPKPIPTAELIDFDHSKAREQLLQDHPEAYMIDGGKLDIAFTENPNDEQSVFPKIRTSTKVIRGSRLKSESDNTIPIRDIKAIGGFQTEIKPGLELEIENYVIAKGEDADNNIQHTQEGQWAAVVITKQDGTETIGYVSLSNQTAPNWRFEQGGQSVELKSHPKLPHNFNQATNK